MPVAREKPEVIEVTRFVPCRIEQSNHFFCCDFTQRIGQNLRILGQVCMLLVSAQDPPRFERENDLLSDRYVHLDFLCPGGFAYAYPVGSDGLYFNLVDDLGHTRYVANRLLGKLLMIETGELSAEEKNTRFKVACDSSNALLSTST